MRLNTALSLLLVVGATISPKKKTKSVDDEDEQPIRKVHEKPKKPVSNMSHDSIKIRTTLF